MAGVLVDSDVLLDVLTQDPAQGAGFAAGRRPSRKRALIQ